MSAVRTEDLEPEVQILIARAAARAFDEGVAQGQRRYGKKPITNGYALVVEFLETGELPALPQPQGRES